ncbi:hypothetical protein N752_01185 [Desulforamulus aquiferis]|nr:hypothetical protein N752_01185 [Desulforamulus aquiferis]
MAANTMVLVLGLLMASFTDIQFRKVPNWLTLSLIFLGLVYNTITGPGWFFSVAGIAAGFILFYPVYLFAGVGAGDAKLMMAVGSFMGMQNTIIIGILSAVINAICSVYVSVRQGNLDGLLSYTKSHCIYLFTKANIKDFSKEEVQIQGKGLPYAVFITLATIIFMIL